MAVALLDESGAIIRKSYAQIYGNTRTAEIQAVSYAAYQMYTNELKRLRKIKE